MNVYSLSSHILNLYILLDGQFLGPLNQTLRILAIDLSLESEI